MNLPSLLRNIDLQANLMAPRVLDPSLQDAPIREEEEEEWFDEDDSETDPSFDAIEETRSALSKMSLEKSKPRTSGEVGLRKCFEKVAKLIKDGQLEKLKVDQCKVYLRQYGLRLTGNKDILIGRIKEHLEIIDGGGEKKYPPSSFVLNCKGDACMGDVVMFEQNVRKMYSIASRSATDPPCGTRIVAGRIVNESYGAAKQQHTFTVEVLWSKGEKPIPPLHPLLIKGRNLYRLKTMRQRWADEGERMKVLQEKHNRGCVARCARETRIQEKEMQKTGKTKRMKEKSNHVSVDEHKCETAAAKTTNHRPNLQSQQNTQFEHQVIPNKMVINGYGSNMTQVLKLFNEAQSIMLRQQPQLQSDTRMAGEHGMNTAQPARGINYVQSIGVEQHLRVKSNNLNTTERGNSILPTSVEGQSSKHYTQVLKPYNYQFQAPVQSNNQHQNKITWPSAHLVHQRRPQSSYASQPWSPRHHRRPLSSLNSVHQSPRGYDRPPSSRPSDLPWSPPRDYRQPSSHPNCPPRDHRQPSSRPNCPPWSPRQAQNALQRRQPCRFYREGRCWHGHGCKYLHD